MNQIIHIEDGEASLAFGRGSTPSPSSAQPAARDAQILEFQAAQCRRPLQGLEEATLPSTFESVGEVAVRLVGRWKLPRLVVMAAPGREEP